jgi:hypothetical protein
MKTATFRQPRRTIGTPSSSFASRGLFSPKNFKKGIVLGGFWSVFV